MNEVSLTIMKSSRMWGVYESGRNVHVAPAWQADDHDLEEGLCFCEPKIEDFGTGTLFVHQVIHET